MADVTQQAVAAARKELGVDERAIPKHVAIIMDGNGRWATRQGLPRSAGHEAGAKTVRRIITESARLGLDALSLYSFSIENWNRPKEEIAVLMRLYAEYLVEERPTVMSHSIRVRHLGRREGLPDSVLKELDETIRVSSSNTGMHLCLALNYSSRAEISDGVQSICRRVQAGELSPENVDPQVIADSLDTGGIIDPDLVVRTSGELRLSNFMLWQVSYAEFYATDACWPEFDEAALHDAIREYASRDRRFGGLKK